MLLYSRKGQIITISTGLLEVKPVYNKEQDTITLNWGSNQQTQRGIIFQQTRPYLEI